MPTNSPSAPSFKIQLSLAGLFFFGPLVRYSLNKGQFAVNKEDVSFVLGYCTVGTIALFFFVLLAITGVLQYLFEWQLFGLLFTFLGILVLGIIFAGVVGIFGNFGIGHFSHSSSNSKDVLPYVPTNFLLLDYLPVFNLYRRYQQHEFAQPNIYLKESLVWWIVISLAAISGYVPLFCGLLLCLVVRIVSLYQQIDFLPASRYTFLNKLFFKNPEEMWAYVLALFVPKKLDYFQQKYRYLFDFHNYTHIKISYILSLLILIATGILGYMQLISGIGVFGLVLFFSRYLLMYFVWHHLPRIPLITEILEGFAWICARFGEKGKHLARLLTLQ